MVSKSLLHAVVWIPATRGIRDHGSHHGPTTQHLCRIAQELSPGHLEMLQTWMHQPQRCILGFVEAQCWENFGVLRVSSASDVGFWCQSHSRSSVVVAGPRKDGGSSVVGSRAPATVTCRHHALLPPCLPPLCLFLSQGGELALLWSGFKNKQKPIIPPRQGASLIKTSGCNAHLETW